MTLECRPKGSEGGALWRSEREPSKKREQSVQKEKRENLLLL